MFFSLHISHPMVVPLEFRGSSNHDLISFSFLFSILHITNPIATISWFYFVGVGGVYWCFFPFMSPNCINFMVPFRGPLLELLLFSKFSISSSWNNFMLPLGVHLWLFFLGFILHPICNNSTVPFGVHGWCHLFSLFPIWPNCNNFMDPLGVLRWWFFFLFPFSILHFTHLQQFQWAFVEGKEQKSITDQIRLFYDEIWTPLAMRTVLTCSHEDQTTVFAFTYSCYDCYCLPILTVTSTVHLQEIMQLWF